MSEVTIYEGFPSRETVSGGDIEFVGFLQRIVQQEWHILWKRLIRIAIGFPKRLAIR